MAEQTKHATKQRVREARKARKLEKKRKIELRKQLKLKFAPVKEKKEDKYKRGKLLRQEKRRRKAVEALLLHGPENVPKDLLESDKGKKVKNKVKKECRNFVENGLINLSRISSAEPYRQAEGITIQLPEGCPDYFPLLKFQDVVGHFPKGLETVLSKFSEPTPIQSQAWPFVLDGKDVVGIAETGSGKTLAFGFPALRHVNTSKTKHCEPSILILAPTRELAVQISDTLAEGLSAIKMDPSDHAICLYGGCSKYDQIKRLNGLTQVVVATPGRLLDLLNDQALSLGNLRYLVFDEADRMLDFGFEPALRDIMSYTNPQVPRQTLMFSATWPMSIRKMAQEYLKSPVIISIQKHGQAVEGSVIADGSIKTLKGACTISQKIIILEDSYKKESILLSLLREHQAKGRIIVFALYKKEAARLEETLLKRGYQVAALHGDKTQQSRFQVLHEFKLGKVPILIATDVAARGLDIPNVEIVINFTFPLTIEDYVHRIGRTGRAGNLGVSITLFTPWDKSHSGELIQVLKNSNQEVPEELLKFGVTIKKKEHKDYGAFYREVDPSIKAKHHIYDQ